MRRRLELVLVAALLAMTAVACSRARLAIDPDLEVLPIGGDFVLTGDDGAAFDTRSLRGRVVLLFFGYTSCPDACPTTMARLTKVYGLLRDFDLDARVQTLFVSVDPERDTPAALHQYLSYFAVPAKGLTGSPEEIAAVAKSFAATYERTTADSAAGYFVNHTTYVFLIDGEGRVRHLFAHQDPPERLAELTAVVARAD
jgi:protein SCO1/2